MQKTFLPNQAQAKLTEWLGLTQVKFVVLYRVAAPIVPNAQQFHANCDKRGPTVSVARTSNGYIFGGYTSQHWSSSGAQKWDPKAFLFRLQTPNGFDPVKLDLIDVAGANAILDHAQNGPVFGAPPHELIFWTNAAVFNGSSNPGSTFNLHTQQNPALFLAGQQNNWNNNNLIEEFEVLQIVPEKLPFFAIEFTPNAKAQLLDKVKNFKVVSGRTFKIDQYNIALFGIPGAGKSCLLNSLYSVLAGRLVDIAVVARMNGQVTKQLTHVPLPDIPVKLWDTMGMDDTSYLTGEIGYIADGNLPANSILSNPIAPKSFTGFVHNSSFKQQAHCVVIVFNPEQVNTPSAIKRMQTIIDVARVRELPILVALTNIDKIDPTLEGLPSGELLADTPMSSRVKNAIDILHEKLGVNPNRIFPVRNYHSGSINAYADILLLRLLENALYSCEDYCTLSQIRNPVQPDGSNNNRQAN